MRYISLSNLPWWMNLLLHSGFFLRYKGQNREMGRVKRTVDHKLIFEEITSSNHESNSKLIHSTDFKTTGCFFKGGSKATWEF